MTRLTVLIVAAASAVLVDAPAAGQVEVETFTGGEFSNPFFEHELEFTTCCFEIANCETGPAAPGVEIGTCVLHLVPNTDFITFNVPPGLRVHTVSVEIQDFEGGFVGDLPTSFVAFRSDDDFVGFNASQIGVPQIISADIDSPGVLTGEPLGEIVQLQLQAANEGNSVIPGFVGAYFDDITVVLEPVCPADLTGDGAVSVDDLVELILAWGPCPEDCPGDLDGDEQVDVDDLVALILAWGPCT